MNEHSFVKAVHKHLHPEVYRWKINDRFTGGVPDAFYAGPAGILFVEYKFIAKLPVRGDAIPTGLSSLQIQWLTRMASYEVPSLVIIGTQNEGVLILESFASTNILLYKKPKREMFNHYIHFAAQETATYIGNRVLSREATYGNSKTNCSKLQKDLESETKRTSDNSGSSF